MDFKRTSENLKPLYDFRDDILGSGKGLNKDTEVRIIRVNVSSRTFDFIFPLKQGWWCVVKWCFISNDARLVQGTVVRKEIAHEHYSDYCE